MDARTLTQERRFRCPACGRVIDGAGLASDEAFKCAKCKKMLRFGAHLWDPQYVQQCQVTRLVVLLGCIALTSWCVMTGYEMGLRTANWLVGFGGALAVWLIAAGCIALAARTTQNAGVLVGVLCVMSGLMLLVVQRLAAAVGYNLSSWQRFRLYPYWVPLLLAAGVVVLAASLWVQAKRRSV